MCLPSEFTNRQFSYVTLDCPLIGPISLFLIDSTRSVRQESLLNQPGLLPTHGCKKDAALSLVAQEPTGAREEPRRSVEGSESRRRRRKEG